MRRTNSAVFALMLAAGVGVSGTFTLAQTQTTVHFSAGNDNAAVNGSVTGEDYADYLLGASAGQTMAVSLSVTSSTGNGTIYFNIMAPGSSGEAIYNGSMDGNDATGVALPADGDYTIRVYQMGNDADSGAKTDYTISFTIT